MKLKRFTVSATALSRPVLSISFRLLLFNILLVFLPIAAVLYLDIYEGQLLVSLEKTMVQQGRILSASLSGSENISGDHVQIILDNLAGRTETRLRVLDSEGWLLGDSSSTVAEEPALEIKGTKNRFSSMDVVEEVLDQDSLLYKMATYPIVLYRKLFNPPVPVDEVSYYRSTTQFRGSEVQAALEGRYGAITRLSSGGQRSVTLYTAIPVYRGNNVSGVVLCSQSTYRILNDLYEIRLFILRIFLASLLAAVLISLFLSRTISWRIKKLRREAEAIRTGKGRLRGSFTPMRLNDEIGYLSRSLNDLTKRLDRHIQFIDSLSRDISHEFKNPLAVIRSATEMICSGDKIQQERFVEVILKNTARMESLLNGIEEISRLDSHLDRERKKKIDIMDLLSNLLDGFKLQYPHFEWHLNNRIDGQFIWASGERLSQVFVNLYENACSFSDEEKSIVTTVHDKKSHAVISIFNYGPLIPEDDLENIFSRFFTSREENKEKHHGLGLSIVKTIVESYGGTVQAVNSKNGVTFSVILPLI